MDHQSKSVKHDLPELCKTGRTSRFLLSIEDKKNNSPGWQDTIPKSKAWSCTILQIFLSERLWNEIWKVWRPSLCWTFCFWCCRGFCFCHVSFQVKRFKLWHWKHKLSYKGVSYKNPAPGFSSTKTPCFPLTTKNMEPTCLKTGSLMEMRASTKQSSIWWIIWTKWAWKRKLLASSNPLSY